MTNILYDGIFAHHRESTKPFLVTHDSLVRYCDFDQRVARLVNLLLERGLEPGARVAVQAEKSVMALALYVAVIRAGGVYLPLNTGYTPRELEYFIKDAAPVLVIMDDKVAASVKPVANETGASVLTLNADESGSLGDAAAAMESSAPVISRDHDDLAAILYTSGTTGLSKGARLTHRNLLSNALVLEQAWGFTADDVLLHMLPIYHTHGLFVASNLLALVGGTMIFLPKFSTDDAIRFLPKATTMMGVPTFYTRMLADTRFDASLGRHMRLFISGSAPLLAETHREFETRTGHRILERYGMTETNMCTSNPLDGERRGGTVGQPLAGVALRIADETGAPVAEGEIGIIEVKGDNVFQGYWQMPEKTAESFRPDGFFITGDMARLDADGYVTIVGRDKDLIISGGLNVYPKEVEALIDAIDGVVESAVIGCPHPDFGEAVVAVVVRSDENLAAESVQAPLSDALARFKQPKEVIFLDALPRNTMGKVQKAELRKNYGGLFSG